MTAKVILPLLALLFLLFSVARLAAAGWRVTPASKAWLLIGTIFSAVSLWLWFHVA
ncbi:MAG: hypothetical protein JSR64_06790 [Nitrospira sp.]|uniref:hypothetical protein n=1 Tax=Thauera sp. 2A1 TaxID=2570191 RepID=UPI001290CB2B|nr:hypothetical protein [Thauera sp. 2A1]KAI5916447.1 hypothetical protein GH664_03125 [Thauera sp. 2A1]MBS0173725.1 hypothetical protein [Nitrospira sp.]